MFEFKNYKQYSDEILHLWNEGFINELEEEGFIVVESRDSETRAVNYRKLTEEEFNNK